MQVTDAIREVVSQYQQAGMWPSEDYKKFTILNEAGFSLREIGAYLWPEN